MSLVVPDWRKPNVYFGWVKLTKNSRFRPAFIFPPEKLTEKHMAQYIQTNGELSSTKHPIEAIATPANVERTKKSKKALPYIKGIQLFNADKKTNYK